jgi:hypothetical protein
VQGGAIVIPRDGFLDKLHLIYTTGDLVVPLTAADATTTANVSDDLVYSFTIIIGTPFTNFTLYDS